MICPYCKNENKDTSNICGYCGFPLSTKNQLLFEEDTPQSVINEAQEKIYNETVNTPQEPEEIESLFDETETLQTPDQQNNVEQLIEIQNGPQYHPANNPAYNTEYTIVMEPIQANQTMEQLQQQVMSQQMNNPQMFNGQMNPNQMYNNQMNQQMFNNAMMFNGQNMQDMQNAQQAEQKPKKEKQPKVKKEKVKKEKREKFTTYKKPRKGGILFAMLIVILAGVAAIYVLNTGDYKFEEARKYLDEKIINKYFKKNNNNEEENKEPEKQAPEGKEKFYDMYFIVSEGFEVGEQTDTSTQISKKLPDSEEICLITITKIPIQTDTAPKRYYSEYLGYNGNFRHEIKNDIEYEYMEVTDQNYDRLATIFKKEAYEITLYNKTNCYIEHETFLNSIELQ